MRLSGYLNERTEDYKQTIEMIRHDCKLFLEESGGIPLYRGAGGQGAAADRKDLTLTHIIQIPRINRIPKDIPQEYHEILDEKFESKFGWKARSEGVFATGNYAMANSYGKAYYFFPIGDFKYIWSLRVHDLYIAMDEISDEKLSFGEHEDVVRRAIIAGIDKLIPKYTDKDLLGAVRSGNEVMFKCKSYYLVNITWTKGKYKEIFT